MRQKVDEFLKMGDEDLARELGYYVLSKMERLPFAQLTRPEQVAGCLTGVEMEINNGGFHQFFWNSPGDYAHQAVRALEELGARHTAGLVAAANAVFGEAGPEADREKRWTQMDQLPESARDTWFELDKAFDENRDDRTALAAAYMRRNAVHFSD